MARKYIFSALTVSCSRVTRPCWPSQSIWKVPAHHTCHWEVVGLRWPCFGVAGCDAVHGEPQGCVRSPPYNPVMCWGKAGAQTLRLPAVSASRFCLEAQQQLCAVKAWVHLRGFQYARQLFQPAQTRRLLIWQPFEMPTNMFSHPLFMY